MRSVIAVAATAAFFLAACGDGDGGSEAESSDDDTELAIQTIAGVPDRVEEEGTARFVGSLLLEIDGQEVRGESEGEMDVESGAYSMETEYEGPDGSTYDLGVRVIDGTMYMDMSDIPGASTNMPEGVDWISVDVPGAANQVGGVGSDPTASLESLRGVSGEVEEVGTEEIDDVATTHYRAEVDPDKALEQAEERLGNLSPKEREFLEQGIELFGDEPWPVEVWIDDDALLRRQTMSFELEIPGAGTADAEVTMDFFDYGTDVEIEAPPADETVTFEDLFGVPPEDIDELSRTGAAV